MNRRIAVANAKGGSGKTTCAVNIAAAVAEEGRQVLLVDLDPNGTATRWLGGDPNALHDVLLDRRSVADAAVVSDRYPKLSVIGSGEWSATAERQIAGQPGADRVLALALDQPPTPWEITIIDCPPSTGLLETNGLSAATDVWAAVATRAMELDGVAQLVLLVDFVRRRINPDLAITKVIPCRFDARARIDAEVVGALRNAWGDKVTAPVPQSVKVAESYSHAEAVTTFAPLSPAAVAYREIARGLL